MPQGKERKQGNERNRQKASGLTNWATHEAKKYVIGNSSESIQSFVDSPNGLHFERCLIIHQLLSPATFSTRPTGKDWKGPSKMMAAPSMVNGPYIWPATTSAMSSLSMRS